MSNRKMKAKDRHLQNASVFRLDDETKGILKFIKDRYGYPSLNAIVNSFFKNIVLPPNEVKDSKFQVFIEDCERGVAIHILRGNLVYTSLTKQAQNDLKAFISAIYGEAIVFDIVQKGNMNFKRYIALPYGTSNMADRATTRVNWEKSIVKGYYKNTKTVVTEQDVLSVMELWFSDILVNGEFEKIRQSILRDELERIIADEEDEEEEEKAKNDEIQA